MKLFKLIKRIFCRDSLEFRIERYLQSLGDTPEEVAQSLSKDGIKGIPGKATQCPIARGIYKNCNVEVSVTCVLYYQDKEFNIPLPVTRFIGMFDGGLFKELKEVEKDE